MSAILLQSGNHNLIVKRSAKNAGPKFKSLPGRHILPKPPKSTFDFQVETALQGDHLPDAAVRAVASLPFCHHEIESSDLSSW